MTFLVSVLTFNFFWWILILIIKPIIIKNNIIPFGPFKGITIQPFVFSKGDLTELEKIHESVHVNQQRKLSPILFYIFYLFDYFICIIKYKDLMTQYRSIEYEVEAFTLQDHYRINSSDEDNRKYNKDFYFNA